MSVMDKLKKNSRLKNTAVLSKSKVFGHKDNIPTSVPMINVGLSGVLDEGLSSGLTLLAGPSKHFKTSFALMMAAAYLKKYDDAVIIFYDSEFGSPQSYFQAYGIDPDRVLHVPIMDVEELKFDMVNQLIEMDRGDHVVIVIDSIGNLASKKEVADAVAESDATDMTRAKQIKSVFRMCTPYMTVKDVPVIAVNHTYMTQEKFSKAVVSGGTGIYLSADTVWILGRQMGERDGTDVLGYKFIINVDKSRFVKEKSKISIDVTWEGGIDKFSGLLDLAVEAGFVHKGKKGRSNGFFHMDHDTGEISEKAHYERETKNDEFWEDILSNQKFKDYVQKKYQVPAHMQEELLAKQIAALEADEDDVLDD